MRVVTPTRTLSVELLRAGAHIITPYIHTRFWEDLVAPLALLLALVSFPLFLFLEGESKAAESTM